jgi:hypothetical protein
MGEKFIAKHTTASLGALIADKRRAVVALKRSRFRS